MRRLIAFLFLVFIALSSIVLFVGALLTWLVTYLFDKRLVVLHLYSSFWASIYVWMMPAWKVKIAGKENIDWKRTYIVCVNHQSLLDILVIFGLFFPFKWVSKTEIFSVPFIGWNMVMNRYIRLKRGDKESIKQMMDDCEYHLNRGSSICMFPEGTRSNTGNIKDFKPGAFILAKKLKLPILPIAIDGTTHALPKKSLNFHGEHEIKVSILPAIEAESFEHMEVGELSQHVRQTIIPHVTTHQNARASSEVMTRDLQPS